MAEGYSVAIRRKDGTEFLCANEYGILPPVWLKRSYAVAHKRRLIEEGFKARVVRVTFERPIPSQGGQP